MNHHDGRMRSGEDGSPVLVSFCVLNFCLFFVDFISFPPETK